MSKKILAALFFSLGVLSGTPLISLSQAEDSVASQVEALEAQKTKAREDYSQQKKDLDNQFKEKMKDLKDTPSDRVRRRELMQEMNKKDRELFKAYKINMMSLEEAKQNLIHPQSAEERRKEQMAPPAAPQMAVPINDLNLKLQQQNQGGLAIPPNTAPTDSSTPPNILNPNNITYNPNPYNPGNPTPVQQDGIIDFSNIKPPSEIPTLPSANPQQSKMSSKDKGIGVSHTQTLHP